MGLTRNGAAPVACSEPSLRAGPVVGVGCALPVVHAEVVVGVATAWPVLFPRPSSFDFFERTQRR